MKHIPDIITTLRLLGAVFLLPSDPASVVFGVIYGLCGVSDMADGYLARRLHAESKAGAVLDSVAVYKRLCFPHTLANKMAGLLLFLSVPLTFWSVIPIAIVAGVATFAAIQEGHFIRKSIFVSTHI